MSESPLPQVEPVELLTIMGVDSNDANSSPSNTNYIIVDVRDDDFNGGNLVGAVNYPSITFESKLDELYNKCADKNQVIFHCAYSKQRGPTCARQFIEYIDKNALPNKDVKVLSGGYLNMDENYSHLKNIFEKK